jgi:hypothetical protein
LFPLAVEVLDYGYTWQGRMTNFASEHEYEPKRGFGAWFGGIWCRLFHRRVMLPIHGYYQCRRCFRRIPISFEMGGTGDGPSSQRPR